MIKAESHRGGSLSSPWGRGHCQPGWRSAGSLGHWVTPTLSPEWRRSQEAQQLDVGSVPARAFKRLHCGVSASPSESLLSKTSLSNNVHRFEVERPGPQVGGAEGTEPAAADRGGDSTQAFL